MVGQPIRLQQFSNSFFTLFAARYHVLVETGRKQSNVFETISRCVILHISNISYSLAGGIRIFAKVFYKRFEFFMITISNGSTRRISNNSSHGKREKIPLACKEDRRGYIYHMPIFQVGITTRKSILHRLSPVLSST